MAVARSDDLRRQNRKLILAALRREGELSRTEIAALTRLSPSTVSIIAGALMAEGILEENPSEAPAAGSPRGRPQVAVRLNRRAGAVAAVSATLDRIYARVCDYAGGEIATAGRRLDMRAAPPGALAATVAEALREAADCAGSEGRVSRISLGVQGVTDAAGRVMIWSPITPERDVAFADLLEAEFGAPVFVANDCAAIVQALRSADPVHYGEDFAALLLAQGVGMGLHLRGAPFRGRRSSAMEFGHLTHVPEGALCRCGSLGCIEAYAGGYAILRKAQGLAESAQPEAEVDPALTAALLLRARAAPGPEREAFLSAGRAIGYGLRDLFTMIDPVPVALVGPGSTAFDLMEPEIRAAIAGGTGLAAMGDVEFRLYADEIRLIIEGGIIAALGRLDEAVAAGGSGEAAAEAQRKRRKA